jgi:hypothetical protein
MRKALKGDVLILHGNLLMSSVTKEICIPNTGTVLFGGSGINLPHTVLIE